MCQINTYPKKLYKIKINLTSTYISANCYIKYNMKKTVVFTGGGTLGHVMPNIYLINELKDNVNCAYIGSNGIEKEKLTSVLGNNFYEIPAVKLVRGKILTNIKIPFVLFDAIFKAKKLLKKLNPAVVFSKGGYVALPVCIAAKMLKIPIIAHESDSSLGLANKIILSICNTMCVNFKQLENKNKKIVYTGAILDKAFENKQKPATNFNLKTNLPTLLIVGGSLGAKSLNNYIVNLANELIKNFNIIHITGKGNLKLKSFENYNSLEMCNNMPQIYNLATFVIGRSGAGVTAECFYKQLPMLLVPLENKASRGDQVQNAEYYKNLGVAKVLHEQNLTDNKMLTEIENFYKNISNYKKAYANLKITNGKEKVLELINNYIK